MTVDIWNKNRHSEKDIAAADCTFYPNAGVYRGNLYDAAGHMIGDYSSADSVEIERRFPGIFGD